jgi:mRNA interferase YafQ
MYYIFRTRQFEKSLVKMVRSGKFVRQDVEDVLLQLSSGETLPVNLREHALKGDMQDRRECHVKGDVLLIYRKDNDVLTLIAIDIGTHHELFGM